MGGEESPVKLLVSPEAAEDVAEAWLWYWRQDPAVAGRFRMAFDEAADRVVEAPEEHQVIYRGTRRVILRRFPFGLYFRVHNDTLVVVACMHLRRAPSRWRART